MLNSTTIFNQTKHQWQYFKTKGLETPLKTHTSYSFLFKFLHNELSTGDNLHKQHPRLYTIEFKYTIRKKTLVIYFLPPNSESTC